MTTKERNEYCKNQIKDLGMFLSMMEKKEAELIKQENYELLRSHQLKRAYMEKKLNNYKENIK
jgi:hypothetical protein